ncbi:MAG: type II toxin-antitoxin system VapC family toxin [Solirubrobacteraceae bacterium]|nr:type II toxin-antitoxin system VapC family toxin [Solirubrobacteraceae bacterium]
MAFYLETSALVKLVLPEAESSALRAWVTGADSDLVASDLVRTELLRAVRSTDESSSGAAKVVLDGLVLFPFSPRILDAAGLLAPPELRSLGAIHLAAALALGDDLDGLVTYDLRLRQAAEAYGLTVLSPGA